MEHISFFIFILLLQKSSNNQLYTARNLHFTSPNSGVQMTGSLLPITRTTKKYFQEKHEAPVLKTIAIKKELMEFTKPPFKIPYTMKTRKPATNKWNNIPYSPANYTQLKKINYRLKTKGGTAEELKNERKREEEKRFSEQSQALDAKKRLQMLERELEMKRELGRAELEPPSEFVKPKRGTVKVKQPLFAKGSVIPEKNIFKVPLTLLAKDLRNGKPLSDNSDSSEDSSEKNDGDRFDLNYDLDNDHELKVKW